MTATATRLTRRSILGAISAVAAVQMIPSAADARTATAGRVKPTRTTTTASSRPLRATAALVLGLASPNMPYSADAYRQTSAALAYQPASATFFAQWSNGGDFPAAQAQQIAQTGATPVLTWEPWDPAAGVNQPAYTHAAIAGGAFDTYLTTWAQQIKAYGGKVVIRLMHEANGTWYPWAVGTNGGTAASFVSAWKHVVGIFTQVGASNAEFRFTVNVDPGGTMPKFEGFYPGDAYVGSVAVDGYNWGTTQSWSSWQSFKATVDATINRVLAMTSTKGLHVDETGCTEVGGDKAAWVRDMFAYVAGRPEILTVTWFDFTKETDWRVASSQASLDAFKAGLGTV